SSSSAASVVTSFSTEAGLRGTSAPTLKKGRGAPMTWAYTLRPAVASPCRFIICATGGGSSSAPAAPRNTKTPTISPTIHPETGWRLRCIDIFILHCYSTFRRRMGHDRHVRLAVRDYRERVEVKSSYTL